ncbi:bifunctional 4-hydroxy-2-oxoglutarate aldolase/2-dehydro-3-deoxy-phosphogluconate aldolase [Thermostichus vulcanus]|uniref:Bifunctional 4-hydroxy-2-oxoglutarate aldolase/2-dehydro-3-deoxy-phosphogluconate aldolase n=1 Tax=Thermostichus vulcanus str. 'Rupite' TaxID=2813851 RepID=A0ABT0CDX2_THEVL|nr:bifunctional 4-hydroxy-2-oxoglutarate aldolase/2-dehydro-3-deoxy-phosphogluconate aldolase [Thermostichus vulcanus]MCJ2543912.1 bifunctional 4-hydroxy-2-oxoglutarate aldolase/2-dehydro-3-deoxy-phosphogluconate aldolase [Thermostichus vulcanus str. 'Rupite']
MFACSEPSLDNRLAHPWLLQLWQQPLIGVIRAQESLTQATQQATVAIRAGIQHIEITTQVPQYLQLITRLRQQYPQCWIGVGTVLHQPMAEQAWRAGAQFCVSPFADEQIIRWGQEVGLPIVPGALTPTEIWSAWRAGATAVKVFPVESLGGSRYIRHLRQPLGSLPLIPTGGVTLANGLEYLQAGAWAVGIAGDLFPPEAYLNTVPDEQKLENRIRQALAPLIQMRQFPQKSGLI